MATLTTDFKRELAASLFAARPPENIWFGLLSSIQYGETVYPNYARVRASWVYTGTETYLQQSVVFPAAAFPISFAALALFDNGNLASSQWFAYGALDTTTTIEAGVAPYVPTVRYGYL